MELITLATFAGARALNAAPPGPSITALGPRVITNRASTTAKGGAAAMIASRS